MSQQKPVIKGTDKVFDKTNKAESDYFVKMPSDLMNYVHVPGYKPQFNYLYTILVDFYNADMGYAYPTEYQLSRRYGVKAVKTIREHLRFLERVGLIKIVKPRANKVYVPYKPLTQAELFKRCPEASKSYNEFIQAETEEKKRTGWLER
ncbi:hypothetical protein [Halobacillus naozhouensis]|uniref:Helix-turn-helix domain-containing protein n=1 Tax=Halobacillus naozhouensis TaxID=554880 RepID=A0ABY8IYK0_9BACI|nr:hypothetical protein [Halobacillus naozhouensis]WFT74881.1 hypothetical protein P9989_00125 [Halobacillus naozhouensis]